MEEATTSGGVERLYIVPGLPHVLLASERSPGWQKLRAAYDEVARELHASQADLILYLSTQWFSVLGHMVQGQREPVGKLVDGNWHDLGTLSYHFKIDQAFAETLAAAIATWSHTVKVVDYEGFPIDTGTVVAANLLNPDNRLPSAMVTFNVYADTDEMVALGRSCLEALTTSGRRAAVVLVSGLSQRFAVHELNPREDRISSGNDDEWNQRLLGAFETGSFSAITQLASQFAEAATSDMGLRGLWWLQGLCAMQDAPLASRIFAYQPVWGTGAAIVGFYPSGQLKAAVPAKTSSAQTLHCAKAPPPVGPYPHARREGDLLFVSGMGPRQAGSKDIPGVTLDENGAVASYDISVQTHSVFANLQAILADAGVSLSEVVDVQVFLTDIQRDFAAFNRVYGEYFNQATGPTRTTVEVRRLPTPIAVELKVIARAQPLAGE